MTLACSIADSGNKGNDKILGKFLQKKHLEDQKSRLRDNIKMDIREI